MVSHGICFAKASSNLFVERKGMLKRSHFFFLIGIRYWMNITRGSQPHKKFPNSAAKVNETIGLGLESGYYCAPSFPESLDLFVNSPPTLSILPTQRPGFAVLLYICCSFNVFHCGTWPHVRDLQRLLRNGP